MMKRLFLLMTILAIMANQAFAQKTWTGATGTAWNTSTNWNPVGVPTAIQNVTIPVTANQPVISGTTTPVCNNLTVNSGAVLTISATSSANAQLTVAGTATFNGGLSIGGVIARTGKLIANNVVWNSTASLTALFGSRMEVSGNWTFASGSNIDMGFCFLTFNGSGTSNIYHYSAGSVFNSITVAKTGSGYVQVNPASNAGFTVKSNLNIQSGGFYGLADIVYYLRGNLLNSGSFVFAGNVRMEKTSGTQQVQPTTGSSFANLTIAADPSTYVSVEGNLTLNGNLTIQSGTLNPNENTLTVFGNWNNTAGPDNFMEGNTSGRVVFTAQINKGEKSTHNYCNYTEHFNILEVNNQAGGYFTVNNASAAVSCNKYDHTHGGVNVQAGSFTINDLADNSIMGYWGLQSGGEINVTQQEGFVDLNGATINITGGDFTVYGGDDNSYWSYQNNSSLTMSGGLFYFAETGIRINTSPALIHNITGGTIKTAHSFICYESTFNPSGGIFEMTGTSDAVLDMWPGSSLHFLRIDKSDDKAAGAKIIRTDRETGLPLDDFGNRSQSVSLLKSLNVVEIAIDEGMLDVGNEKTVTLTGNLTINDGGGFQMGAASQLRIAGEMAVNVNSGGTFRAIGSETNNALITRYGSFYYYFNVQSGATIAARHAWFQYMANIVVGTDATVDPNFPFDYCTFSHGQGTFLVLNTTQELTIHEANFPTLPPTNNVAKVTDAGRITFKDATGAYSGPAYEHDPHDRIDWTETQPGLWTGAVSTEWWNSGNWDGGIAPTAAINVVIPETAPNWPVLDVGDWECNNLTIHGTLIFGSAYLTAFGNMEVNGTIETYAGLGNLTVYGDVDWNPGAVADEAGLHIMVRGNWNFNEGSDVYVNARVYFEGDQNKWIRNYSETSKIHSIYVTKTGGAQIGFSDFSTHPLVIENDLIVFSDAKFVSDSYQDIILKGDLISDGITQFNGAALKLAGDDQSLKPNVNDYFNHLVFAQTGTATVNTANSSIINIKGNLHIDSGIFEAGSCTINIQGNWDNNVGMDAFVEGGSRVIFNGGNYHQYCHQDESFSVLEVNKSAGGAFRVHNSADVSCAEYDWTAGAVDVLSGSFTAPVLTDNGIAGDYFLNPGGTITLGNLSGFPHLKGNLTIYGGTFNIIAPIESQWPGNGDASITMEGGELNVYPYGIEIVDNPPYTFTTNIIGGKIRTEGSFINHRSDFAPEEGTIELYGPNDASLTINTGAMGILHNVVIDKQVAESKGGSVTISETLLLTGGLDVNNGRLNCISGTGLLVYEYVNVDDGATLSFEPNSALSLYPGCSVSIYDGGTFETLGTESQPIIVNRLGNNGYYEFGVAGTISSRFTTFDYCETLIIGSSGYIDPENAFYHCSFPNSNGPRLMINNSQSVTLVGVVFPNVQVFNVGKQYDTGYVLMKDATGPGAGVEYEYDPFDRISWEEPQPGLWTGNVSTDWHNPGNWDDLNVPDLFTDVTIPETVASGNMPLIQQDATCNSVTLNGIITVNSCIFWVYEDFLANGELSILPGELAQLTSVSVFGDLVWMQNAFLSNVGELKCGGDLIIEENAVFETNGDFYFIGANHSSLINLSGAYAYFHTLQIYKHNYGTLFFDQSSTGGVETDFMRINDVAVFIINSDQEMIINGSLSNSGKLECETGTIVIRGTSSSILMNEESYLNNLEVNPLTVCHISTNNSPILMINGDLTINSGKIYAHDATVTLGGNWINNVGAGGFVKHDSRVIFNSNDPEGKQFIYGNTDFNILELQQHPDGQLELNDGSVITIDHYDWTSGWLRLTSCDFTVNNLMDDRMAGGWIIQNFATVNLYDENAIGLGGHLIITGGLLNIFGGADFFGNIPSGADAIFEMFAGTIDFHTQSVHFVDDPDYTLECNIFGGLIRTAGWFFADNIAFQPGGGSVEIYDANPYDCFLRCDNGAYFNKLVINKNSMDYLTGLEDVNVKDNLEINQSNALVHGSTSLTCHSDILINNSVLTIESNNKVWMGNDAVIRVGEGSEFHAPGVPFNQIIFSAVSQSDYYHILVENGGHISAEYCDFNYLDETGIYISEGATIAEDMAFNHCAFKNGKEVPFAYLTVNNDQELMLNNVEFSGTNRGKNAAKNLDNGSLTFFDVSGNLAGAGFEFDPFDRIFWLEDPQYHPMLIPAGWSGLSSYLIPVNPAIENVFAPIADQLIIAQTMTEMYYPGQNINTIGNWESHSAYKIKVTEACDLLLTGSYETDMTVSLNAGWSLMPQLINSGCYPDELFPPVESFVMAKDIAGTGVYWPQYGINTLGIIMPGKAYYVLMNEAGEVDFTGLKSSGDLTGLDKTLSVRTGLESFNITSTPSTHTIAIQPEALKDFEPGTIITACDHNGNCFGAAQIADDNNYITTFGDDPTTAEKDGFFEGEMIFFKTGFQNLSGLEPTFNQTLPQSDGLFTENGLSAIAAFKEVTEFLGISLLGSVKVFPIPSEGMVKISGILPGTSLTVTDIQGKVLMEKIAYSENTEFDLTDYQPGVYFLKVAQNGDNIFRKIVLK